jgi:hypothetical protein
MDLSNSVVDALNNSVGTYGPPVAAFIFLMAIFRWVWSNLVTAISSDDDVREHSLEADYRKWTRSSKPVPRKRDGSFDWDAYHAAHTLAKRREAAEAEFDAWYQELPEPADLSNELKVEVN